MQRSYRALAQRAAQWLMLMTSTDPIGQVIRREFQGEARLRQLLVELAARNERLRCAIFWLPDRQPRTLPP